MNIANLLSPQDSSTKEESQTPPPRSPRSSQSPHARIDRPSGLRKSSGLNRVQQYSPPPQNSQQQQYPHCQPQPPPRPEQPPNDHHHQPVPAQHVQAPQFPASVAPNPYHLHQSVQNVTSPGSAASPSPVLDTAHNGRAALNSTNIPPMCRHGSTPTRIDALADFVSTQHRQQSTQKDLRSPRPFHPGPSVSYTLHNLARTMSSTSAKDVTMNEQSQLLYTAALSAADNEEVNGLLVKLKENSYDYTSHIRLVELLARGLREHTHPLNAPNTSHDPCAYELLSDLRRARREMHAKFAMGEVSWTDWIQDEKMLARSTDDRLSVMELCMKSVQEEPSSSTLWRLYGDYMYWLWAAAFEVESAAWSDDDKAIGREVFSWQAMNDVWDQALQATQWHINDSHVVWSRWMEIMLRDQEARPEDAKVHFLRKAFNDRLLKPHAAWEDTFQMYSSFITRYLNTEYEDAMMTMTKRASQTRQQFAWREQYELKVDKAVKSGDRNTEWEAYLNYLEWELRNKGVFSFNLINALFERATVRFSTEATIWRDYVEFLMEHPDSGVSVLSVLERATRHCPWSGELWSHRLLALEAEGRSFDEIESIKHSATETGLLDVGGLEELLKVYIAWCGFLRRKAFDARSCEDDVDIAEVGIRSALEHVKEIGERTYGKDFQGDPQYRLERINIQFITQSGNIQSARDCWRALIERQQNSYDFWYRFYMWEMLLSPMHHFNQIASDTPAIEPPRQATNTLRQAIKRVGTMDWPENLIGLFISHCEQHESVHEYRYAILEARKAKVEVVTRRQREAADDITADIKRKRLSEAGLGENVPKKVKKAEQSCGLQEPSSAAASQLRRDRENTTIIMSHIPASANETKVRRFFRGCGQIKNIKLVADCFGAAQTATVEFETQQDAQFAVSRDGRLLDDESIQILLGTGSTLWVTNYPPEANEAYIRQLFALHGEIVSVRFPSLKYNTHRRFCYVTFANAQQAGVASEALNGKQLGTDLQLQALVSDPSRKRDRHGATYEDREVFIGNIDHRASDQQVQDIVSPLHGFSRVRVPRTIGGNMKGVAFVEFVTAQDAGKAVEALNGREYMQRKLRANIAQPKTTKRQATAIIGDTPLCPASSSAHGNSTITPSANELRERTVAIINIPDTVNDARVRSMVEAHGALKKVILMPRHQGAIIEFVHVSSVGKATLALDGYEIEPGRKLRVTTVEEMKAMRAEQNVNRSVASQSCDKQGQHCSKSGHKSAISMQPVPPARRPSASAAGRRGGKGGLGTVRSVDALAESPIKDFGTAEQPTKLPGGKSNADFKAMLLESRKGSQEVRIDGGTKASSGQ